MIYLFHGDDIVSLRKALINFKQKYNNLSITYLPRQQAGCEGKDWIIEELKQALKSRDLFCQKKLIIAEMIKPRRGASSSAKEKELLEILDDLPAEIDLVFVYFEKLAKNSAFLKKIEKQGKVFIFEAPDPQKIFPFLDAFAKRDQKKALLELDILLKELNDPFYIITMIAWQLRNLIKTKELGAKVPGLHPFVARKSYSAAAKFTMEELRDFFDNLWGLDLDVKLGKRDAVVGIQEIIFKL